MAIVYNMTQEKFANFTKTLVKCAQSKYGNFKQRNPIKTIKKN